MTDDKSADGYCGSRSSKEGLQAGEVVVVGETDDCIYVAMKSEWECSFCEKPLKSDETCDCRK